ncbi:YidC/Oxa1 family membrane protein insertase [Patescibacteria group bacterium]|nr:YidC/Oxa1 family membrane protein insertase [Patescibacteria group bacterium]MBU1683272.1 YidC/Oxa1 family membrane protein insertase [Patescibacteria group bacterium]MBU1935065.1 YidC/Oxa1 family membrane protein insertase [Patescibacteria group bacterium]
MKTKIKKLSLIFTTLVLFALSIYIAFVQGNIGSDAGQAPAHLAASFNMSPVVYTGLQAHVANFFTVVINSLMSVFGDSVLLSIVVLALIVELVLLYPSVRIQLKQKKIHIFHKKLIDRFNSGELKLSETKHELNLLYAVNEKMHARGAVFVVIQLALFITVLWGLYLLVQVPYLLHGSWNVLNFSLLSQPASYFIPFLAGLIYFLHSLTKIYYKEKEDYISRTQSRVALLFAVVGSVIVYLFAGTFAVALTLYFITLITFATIRYIVVEQHARNWGKFARKELIEMLRHTDLHKNKFDYLSRKWNHLPVVRNVNFHLLEEALSMSLGILLALNVLGVLPV